MVNLPDVRPRCRRACPPRETGSRWISAAVAFVVLALCLFPSTPAHGQEGSTERQAGSLGKLLRLLSRLRRGLAHDLVLDLETWAGDPSPEVRATVGRLWIEHPELIVEELAEGLLNDPDDRVATLTLLALSQDGSEWSLSVLEAATTSSSAIRREFAAVSILVRAAIADELGRPLVSADLQESARIQIASDPGLNWTLAIEQYLRVIDLEEQWARRMGQLRALELEGDQAACASLVRLDPALLLALNDTATGAYRMEATSAPDRVLIRERGHTAADLLVRGLHDPLADLVYLERERIERLDETIAGIEQYCREGVIVEETDSGPVFQDQSTELRSPDRKSDWRGWAGVGLGITNHPFAFRPGRQPFVLGADIEFAVLPEASVTYLSHAQNATDERCRLDSMGLRDGFGIELVLGGLLSSQFFEDRSRPSGVMSLLLDRPLSADLDTVQGLSLWSSVSLSAGGSDVAVDLTREPLPQVGATMEGRYRREQSSDPTAPPVLDLASRIDFTQHVFDDPGASPRDRRWLEPKLSGRWLGIELGDGFAAGVGGDAGARTTEELDDLSALSANLEAILSWNGRTVGLTLGSGMGFGWNHQADDAAALAAVMSLALHYTRPPGGTVRINHQIILSRRVTNLGRTDRVGVIERGDARVAFSFTEVMREPIAVGLFFERAQGMATEERLGWGGIQLEIPVSLRIFDQELSYRMRYLTLIDSSRFAGYPQEVFEATLEAGMRF